MEKIMKIFTTFVTFLILILPSTLFAADFKSKEDEGKSVNKVIVKNAFIL